MQDQEFSQENLALETIQKISELSYVKYFDYSSSIYLSSALKRYEGDRLEGEHSSVNVFSLKGVGNPDLIDIKEGQMRLVSGRSFSLEDLTNLTYAALVSQTVAQENNLVAGSRITFDNSVNIPLTFHEDGSVDTFNTRQQVYEIEIIGIYETTRKFKSDGSYRWDSQGRDINLENIIYVPNRVVEEANRFQASVLEEFDPEAARYFDTPEYTSLYVLKDPLALEEFKDAVAELVPDYYKVVASGSYDMVASSMKSIRDMATMVLIVTVGAGLIILSLIITLFLRDRKHEIGIYMSLGERKLKVAMQIVFETVVVAVIAITLALFTGSILSGALSEKMIADQVIAAESERTEQKNTLSDLDWMGYSDNISSSDIIQSYSVSLDLQVGLLFYLIGIGAVIVSTIVPIIYMVRMNPKKILM
jgi:putative ABC transport system permease protein